MEALFLKVVNMGLAASWLVLAVMVLRPVLRRAPRWVFCLLWALVAVRLVCPVNIESALSLVPSGEPLPEDILYTASPRIQSGVEAIDEAIDPALASSLTPTPGASANPTQIWWFILSRLWAAGAAVMGLYALISWLLLRRRVSTATKLRDNIKESERVASPFVLGLFRPVIYLPYAMEPADLEHVTAHERAHIRRGDHWWKPLGFMLLAVYWFDPLLWAAYILFCRDMEAACDEKVIREMGLEGRRAYAGALLRCGASRPGPAACPLSFGEVGVKSRIKNVLNYKKPARWVTAVSLVLVLIAAVCFLTGPKAQAEAQDPMEDILERYRTEYVGDAVKVSKIAQMLPYPKGYGYSSIELQTDVEPYGLTVRLSGSGELERADFQEAAAIAFEMIGNLRAVSFWQEDAREPMASYARDDFNGDDFQVILYGGILRIKSDAHPGVTRYDLREGALELTPAELEGYVFYTNSTKIAVTVDGGEFAGTVILRDITQEDAEIGRHSVAPGENKAVFTALTAARLYRIEAEGLNGCTLTVGER